MGGTEAAEQLGSLWLGEPPRSVNCTPGTEAGSVKLELTTPPLILWGYLSSIILVFRSRTLPCYVFKGPKTLPTCGIVVDRRELGVANDRRNPLGHC